MATETETKDMELHQITELFGQTIQEKYFSHSKQGRSFFMMVTDGDNFGCCVLGKGGELVNAFANIFHEDKRVAEVVSSALMGTMVEHLIKKTDDNKDGYEEGEKED